MATKSKQAWEVVLKALRAKGYPPEGAEGSKSYKKDISRIKAITKLLIQDEALSLSAHQPSPRYPKEPALRAAQKALKVGGYFPEPGPGTVQYEEMYGNDPLGILYALTHMKEAATRTR